MVSKDKRPLHWVGSSRKDLKAMPKPVKCVFAYALFLAELGGKHPDAKPLKGFGGAGVLEVVDDYDGDTYRAVYTVKFDEAVYVLHAFQKKSKSGGKTPKSDLEKIETRLKEAQERHKQWQAKRK